MIIAGDGWVGKVTSFEPFVYLLEIKKPREKPEISNEILPQMSSSFSRWVENEVINADYLKRVTPHFHCG